MTAPELSQARHRAAETDPAFPEGIEIERGRPWRASVICTAVLVIGVAVSLYSGGTVVLVDALLLILLPTMILSIRRDRVLVAVWSFALLWMLAQFASDLVNQVSLFANVALIGPLAALLVSGLLWLHREFGVSPAMLLAATGLGWIALELTSGVALSSGDPWKYGLATPVTLTTIALAYWLRVPRVGIVVLFGGLSALSLASDSRFDFGLELVGAAAAAVVPHRPVRRSRQGSLLSGLAIAVGLLFLAYPSVALSGLLGERALSQQTRFEAEDVNFLLAARVEFPQITHLMLQSPLFGIGADGRLSSTRAYDALQYIDQNVIPLDVNLRTYLLNADAGYIGYNAHTAAMSSALYAGVLALPFWLLLLGLALFAVIRVSAGRSVMPALVIYFAGRIGWDSLFSPLYNHTHLLLGIALAVFLFGIRGRTGHLIHPTAAGTGTGTVRP